MEHPVLIDSNIYIALMREGIDPLAMIHRHLDIDRIASCGVVKAEVLRGVKGLKAHARMAAYFEITSNIGTPSSLWDDVTHLALELDRKGTIIPLTDIIIACCAKRAGAAIMTRDRHFDVIPGITLLPPPW